MVPMEGVEPTHSHEYQILSLARLPIPPHRLFGAEEYRTGTAKANRFRDTVVRPRSLVAECARPRAQQLPTERGAWYFPAGSTFLHCCARGRAHSGPRLPPLTEGLRACPVPACTLHHANVCTGHDLGRDL